MRLPRDTAADARRRQLEIFAAMSPAQRLRIAAEMTDEMRAITEAGIRARHPGWSETAVSSELRAILRRSHERDTRPAPPGRRDT